MLSFKVKANDCVPAGAYRARFETVETTEHKDYGAGLKFVFSITKGQQQGRAASRITSAVPTLRNAAGKLIAGIIGRAIEADEDVDLAPFVGREYLLNVAPTANGESTRIESLIAADAA